MNKDALEQLRRSACAEHYKKIGLKPHHGFILMLSSLHSKKSAGIGEFLDCIPLMKWAKEVGLSFIQFLPLNDSGMDNSPYNPISTLALNPVYLSLHAFPYLEKSSKLQQMMKNLQNQKLSKKVNYHLIRRKKMGFFRTYFVEHFSKIKKLKNFASFVKENHHWLDDYALYNVLTDHYRTAYWPDWEKKDHVPSLKRKTEIRKLYLENYEYYQMLQYLCFEQLKEVKKEASRHKIFLFGDLPFLVSKYSVDVWSNPNLFLTEEHVGSPPDDLTPDGQDWNFPAYNWSEHKKTHYAWWKQRLKTAENFFDIYRLDHIIGFYRTWNIPKGKKGRDGFFSPKDPSLWLDHGQSFLKVLIQTSKMLPIGEDLVIPKSIIDSIKDLGICGTRILTWQRTGAGGMDFVHPPLYTVATITHVASHDTVTLAQWWQKYPKVAKLYAQWRGWSYTKTLDLKKRFEILKASHETASLFHANLLQEYLALFPEMVHKNKHDERINYPGTPSYKNWRYRFIPSVEEIVKKRSFSELFKKIVC